MNIQPHFPDRWAVLAPGGWLARNTGHDYTNDCPTYELTQESRFARLYLSKGPATKAANVIGGKVVRVLVEAIL